MDQSTGLLSGLCGLGIVCSGLLLVALFLAIRFTGRGFLPLLALVVNRRARGKPVDVRLPSRRRVDVRARAQSVDFDSALAAAAQNGPVTTPPPAPQPPPMPNPDTSALPPANPNLPWRNGRRRGNEDEIFGGMLDRDGDGEVDFLADMHMSDL